jgi:hypothetical protein
VEETSGFSGKRLQQGRTVLGFAKALANDVIKGTVSLDEAVERVNQENSKAQNREVEFERLRRTWLRR